MKKRCILNAPAKLNLHLQIGERRQDGFHEINSLFVMVDLCDEIDARSLKTGNDCRIIGEFNCSVEDNLIYRAWKEFCTEAGREFGVEFKVIKNIPSFAGLGGGSSDAAAVIKIMNMMFETGFEESRLAEIGSRIGSDIPFFVSQPAALIRGRGDVIQGIDAEIHDFVVIHPDIEISTRDAYRWIDSSVEVRKPFLTEDEILEIYRGKFSSYENFTNDFSHELEIRYNIFSEMKLSLMNAGALYTSITGSGSAVYGLFKSRKDAENAENSLQNRYKFVQKIKSLDRIPYAILE